MTTYTTDPPAWVRPYLGIPYRERDCWQLCALVVFERGGIQLPDFAEDYERSIDETLWSDRIRGQVGAVVEREKVGWPRVEGDPEPLDIALYRVRGDRWHVATVIGGGWALNTDLKRGSHPMRLRDSAWARLLEGYYRGSRSE